MRATRSFGKIFQPIPLSLSARRLFSHSHALCRLASADKGSETRMGAISLALLLTALLAPWCVAQSRPTLAPLPPMGWNDWAHYQCDFTAQTILQNARALVRTGLAARGYQTVTIDDCWMLKDRDAQGNLQADPQRFPHGIKPVADAVHSLGLKFGTYEDAGAQTCGGYAGSGVPDGGGRDHFLQDARLFASWGVDYLKLDGCNVYAAPGESQNAAYRKAYLTQSMALRQVSRPVIFSESAPAYFQDTTDWYDVLSWVRHYGQLWREGSDIATFDPKAPNTPRFHSVLWNYAYNLPLGRFQSPGNWNDADFLIAGDAGITPTETRSQIALWSMMSAPLILSSDLNTLSPASISALGNQAVLSVDQDPLGRMATLLRRTPSSDLLFKELAAGRYAVAVLNRGNAPLRVELHATDLGFQPADCRFASTDLWSGAHQLDALSLQAVIAPHDTAIWKIHPVTACGLPARTGVVTRLASGRHRDAESYTLCLASSGTVEACSASEAQRWTVTAAGALESSGKCLAAVDGKVQMQACTSSNAQRWQYTLLGDLINRSNQLCLTGRKANGLTVETCGHSPANQIWSLPNNPTYLPK
ncbi:MAG: ricin-type beta-trefoil lectin domain protein [Acidobacteriaceae bacterium]